MKKYLVLASLLTASNAYTAGIAIIEQSVSGFKTGYAGAVTSLDEPSTVFFNPAALSRVPGKQVTVGAHMLSPKAVFNDEGSTSHNGQKLTPTTPADHKDVAETLYIPNVFGSYQLSDRLTFGLGVYSPFGLGIKHKKGWIGRYYGTTNDMLTLNVNPSFAFKVTKHLTLGFGLSAQYVKAELCSDIDFGGIAFAKNLGSGYQQADGSVKVTGDGMGFGFNFGVLYETSRDSRIGLSYRSSLASNLKGKAEFKRSSVGDDLNRRSGLFQNCKVETEVTFPETLIMGYYRKIDPKWAIMGDVQYTNWKRFKELRVQFDNAVQPDDVTPLNWKRVMRYAYGMHYYPNSCLTLGAGLGIDKSPVSDEHRSPRIPDADRKFWTAGLSYQATNWLTLDLGGGAMYFENPKIDLKSTASESSKSKGNLKGHFKSSVWIGNVGLRIRM